MKPILRTLVFGMVIMLGIGVFMYFFLAIFIRKYASATGVTYDGLGRALVDTPAFFRTLGYDPTWAGMKYFAIDLLVFWGAAALIMGLVKIADKFKTPPGTNAVE